MLFSKELEVTKTPETTIYYIPGHPISSVIFLLLFAIPFLFIFRMILKDPVPAFMVGSLYLGLPAIAIFSNLYAQTIEISNTHLKITHSLIGVGWPRLIRWEQIEDVWMSDCEENEMGKPGIVLNDLDKNIAITYDGRIFRTARRTSDQERTEILTAMQERFQRFKSKPL